MDKNNFVKYVDLLTIKKVNEETTKEEFVFLPRENDIVIGKYVEKCNMLQYGENVPIRKSVYNKLLNAAKKLQSINKNYVLLVVYGYRAMEMQVQYFNEIYEDVKDKFDDKVELYEYIHEKIAVPEVAGHPTGGAVDIEIYDVESKKAINFGAEILDWDTTKCYYENDSLTEEERNNRRFLRELMMSEGFAPYDGEWWHFSYGDKEWAFYYKKEEALYNQIDSKNVYNN